MSRLTAWFTALSPNARRGVIGGAVGTAVVAVVATVALVGGGGGDEAAVVTTTTTTSTTSTTAPPNGPKAPLTGLPVSDASLLARPPLAVKIDNLDAAGESAVPQTGLIRADVVYEEIVEANITRLVGVFHSEQPGTVGPVRSARTTDIHLLPQLGRPLLAFSGGNDGVLAALAGSEAIVDVGANRAPDLYRRERSRRAPHNLFVTADKLWGRAPDGLPGPNPLFLFRADGAKAPATAVGAQGVDITWGGGGASSPVTWRWSAKTRRYLRDQRGRPHKDSSGTRLSATNVVVLVTEYGRSAADARSPEAHTVGSGDAYAFTNGWLIRGRWSRTAEDRPATLTDTAGTPILLTPGQTWVELPRAGGVTPVR